MKVVLLGSGNVATHLAQAFTAAGMQVIQVWSNTLANAKILAEKVGAEALVDVDRIDRSADLYVISVKDDAIATVAERLKGLEGLVVHTSGATALDVLNGMSHPGILYPLQTFSKAQALDFSKVPLCLESAVEEDYVKLEMVSRQLSTAIYRINSAERKVLHLAAVFVCNFPNYLYQIGHELVADHELSFDLLRPLILETALKVQHASPVSVQTGPAVRGDEKTMQRHMGLLNNHPVWQDIYESMSKNIKNTQI